MKMLRRFAQLQVLLLSLLSSTVVPIATHADDVHGRFTLTQKARWGSMVLAPGEYTFSFATRSSMPVILLREIGGNGGAFICASAESDTSDTTPNAIKIETKDGVRVITELHINDVGLILYYDAKPPAQAAAKAPEPKLTAYKN